MKSFFRNFTRSIPIGQSSKLIYALRGFGFVLASGLFGILGYQHHVAMEAGYREMPRLPSPELQIPLSTRVVDVHQEFSPEQCMYTVYLMAAAASDPLHLVDVAQTTVRLDEIADLEIETKMVKIKMNWNPQGVTHFLGNQFDSQFSFPLANGEWLELPPKSHHALFKAYGLTIIPISTLGWSDPARWMGWGATQGGLVAPYQFFVAVVAMEPDTPLVEGGIEELCVLDMAATAWLQHKKEEGPIDSLQENLVPLSAPSSIAKTAHHHIGLPLTIAMFAAAVVAVSIFPSRWMGVGFALTSIVALALLAVLDFRATRYACAVMEDREQPSEIRLQAAAKGCGSFFWRHTIRNSMQRVINDDSEAEAVEGIQKMKSLISQ